MLILLFGFVCCVSLVGIQRGKSNLRFFGVGHSAKVAVLNAGLTVEKCECLSALFSFFQDSVLSDPANVGLLQKVDLLEGAVGSTLPRDF